MTPPTPGRESEKPMIEVVTFDLDDTLWDVSPAIIRAEKAQNDWLADHFPAALFGESRAMLQKIQHRFTIGALTNGNADVYRTPLGDYFDFAIKAEQVGGAKPLPHLFEAALRHTGVAPSALVHVGDNHDHDIEGAKKVGLRAIWYSAAGEVSDRADASIRCLSELPTVLASMGESR